MKFNVLLFLGLKKVIIGNFKLVSIYHKVVGQDEKN